MEQCYAGHGGEDRQCYNATVLRCYGALMETSREDHASCGDTPVCRESCKKEGPENEQVLSDQISEDNFQKDSVQDKWRRTATELQCATECCRVLQSATKCYRATKSYRELRSYKKKDKIITNITKEG